MSDARSQQEPSMEEILASIRRIISEDAEPEAKAEPPAAPPVAAMDEDVLELTQMVRDDGSVVSVEEQEEEEDPWAAASEPEPEPEPDRIDVDDLDDLFDRPRFEPSPRMREDDDDLVSASAAAATTAAFAQLATSIGGGMRAPAGLPLHAGGPTLESIVKDMLRPMMRDWLDEHLPPMVERMVQREIEKMVRRAQGG
jgi:cell pole-organizing protein PopZ